MSAHTVSDILKMTWVQQAACLKDLPRKDLEILWFQIQRHGEALDKLKLAVFSILRDLYEARGKAQDAPERELQRNGNTA